MYVCVCLLSKHTSNGPLNMCKSPNPWFLRGAQLIPGYPLV